MDHGKILILLYFLRPVLDFWRDVKFADFSKNKRTQQEEGEEEEEVAGNSKNFSPFRANIKSTRKEGKSLD